MISINIDAIIEEEFKELAKHTKVSQKALFEFLWIEFLKSGTPQSKAARLGRLKRAQA